MPIDRDCPKDSDRLVGDEDSGAFALEQRDLDLLRETYRKPKPGTAASGDEAALHEQKRAAGAWAAMPPSAPDRWKDAQAVVNLVLAAEDVLTILDTGGCECLDRLRAALKAME